ncbi:MAG: ATP-dependent DNA helicase RecG [Deltaproteobacteria bacterium]|nr:MAG: ATP-dependent DNA helicase RecG [Deltaproteobacteria bacterium]
MPAASLEHARQILSTPISSLRGVGPRIADRLTNLGVRTVEDALYTLPHRYEDRREFRRIGRLREGRHEVFAGEILAAGEMMTQRSRRRVYEVIVGDGSGQVVLKWFHYRKEWLAKRFSLGHTGVFSGEVKRFGHQREVHHPDIELLAEGQTLAEYQSSDPLAFGRILPVYPLTEGLTQHAARRIWKQAVDLFARHVATHLPSDLRTRRGLLPLAEALQQAHWPASDTDLEALEEGRDPARRTLVYDEFFFLQLGLALRRRGQALEPGIPFQVTHRYTKLLAEHLPYRLTGAQRRVLGEIKADLMAPHPMNRLVQGDVGSGKTIVALMTALLAIENDTQVAVVAPTEILAEQHYLQFHHWLEKLGLKAVLLRGQQPAAERRLVLRDIASGAAHLVVGTHAVLQDGVDFRRLGLGIIDEQHRFGVRQRAILRQKGENPHVLVMTATPIPRTLSLTVYGDLALSVIDELPPGRTPIRTMVVTDNRRAQALELIRREIGKGHQIYVVFPLIEESEKSDLKAATAGVEQLRSVLPQCRIGLLHGRMSPDEKEAVMGRFKSRQLDILASTTVIEVGIDIPNATVMIVEHAERFGLAQLHQLRGRVGRGTAPGLCLLMKSLRCSEEGVKRLEVMESTTDGFRIAEADLEIRGPGEFLGTRQSGLPDFRVANILRDARVLEEARADAFAVAESGEFQEGSGGEGAAMLEELRRRWGARLGLASVG